jgi:hypothetical protein
MTGALAAHHDDAGWLADVAMRDVIYRRRSPAEQESWDAELAAAADAGRASERTAAVRQEMKVLLAADDTTANEDA